MTTTRMYHPEITRRDQNIALPDDISHRILNVLRMRPNEAMIFFSGEENLEYHGHISEIRKHIVTVSIDKVETHNRESPLSIHLFQAIPKGDKMEWIVQKTVELGVSAITPLISEHNAITYDTKRMLKKMQQWQAIAIQACEQCGRNTIPTIHPPLRVAEYKPNVTTSKTLLFSPRGTSELAPNSIDPDAEIHIFNGPEGGFSPQEENFLATLSAHVICLGPRILRTETAAIVEVSLIQGIAGDL